jgi:hypothetical protein
MAFVFSLQDLGILLGVMALVTLTTSELISPYYVKANFAFSRKRLRQSGFVISLAFIVTAVIRLVLLVLPA